MSETNKIAEEVAMNDSQSFSLPSNRQNYAYEVVQSMHKFWRGTEIHEAGNQIFAQLSLDLYRSITLWTSVTDQDFEFRLQSEQIYFSGVRIRPRYHLYKKISYLNKFLKKHRISAFKVPRSAKEAELFQFFDLLARTTAHTLSHPLQELINREQLAGFIVEQLGGSHSTKPLNAVQSAYDGICQEIELLTKSLERSDEDTQKSKLGTHVLSLNDIPHSEIMLFIADFKSPQKYSVPIEVAAFSSIVIFAWAKSLALPIKINAELATMTCLQPAVTHGSSGMDLNVTETRASHLLGNLNAISRALKLSSLQILSLYEFLIPFGKDGVYESSGSKCYQHFFSRILRIVTLYSQFVVFDRRRKTLTPSEAVQKFATEKMGCDQALVRLFIHWIGYIPIGSNIRLSSGEIAKVISTQDELSKSSKPHVVVYKDKDGNPLNNPRVQNLQAMREGQGLYEYGIEAIEKSDDVQWNSDQLEQIQNAFYDFEMGSEFG